jgi:hypothetical protein
VTERKPRRPSDGIKRSSSAGAGARRTTRGDGPPKREPRRDRDGAPKRASGSGGGRSGGESGQRRASPAKRSSGAAKRSGGARTSGARTGGAPKRDTRGGARKPALRSDGSPRREGRAAGAPKREPRGTGAPARQQRRDGPQKRQSRGGASSRTGRSDSGGKRTSRNSDDRNPTRSGVDYPTRKFRRKDEEAEVVSPPAKSSLRKVRRAPVDTSSRPVRGRKAPPKSPTRRRRLRTTEAGDELARIAGRGARHAQTELARAAEAYEAGRERDAARLLRPLRDAYPDASAVRELLGLAQYRLGQYAAATKELEAFVDLTNSVEQHPVLMDCARALGKHRRVEELWEELAAASPTGALVTEGRIVLAGTRADQGRLNDAIATLDRRGGTPNRVQDHHVRVWYALADLYERAGDLPRARELFLRIRAHDAGFADVAERLATLG